MVPLTSLLTGVFVGTAVGAILPQPPVQLQVRHDDDNLISPPDEAGDASDDTPIIQFNSDIHILQPLRPSHESKLMRRSAGSAFDVLHEDTLYWQDSDGTTAEFHINLSGPTEGIVNLEYFDDLVNSIYCPRNSTGPLAIAFSDKIDFDTAAEVWKWLMIESDNHFLIMVGAGDCGWNKERILYRVDSLTFSDKIETAFLNAEPVTWKKSIPYYELSIGKAASEHASTQGFKSHQERSALIDFNPDFTVPFEFDVSGKSLDFDIEDVEFIGTCQNCSVQGEFDFEAKFAIGIDTKPEAWLQVGTPGVAVTAILNTTVKGELKHDLIEQQLSLAEYHPYGIHIPGIISIGPSCKVSLRAGISSIKGSASMVFGGTVRLVPSYARLDFLNQNNTGTEGWKFEFIEHPLEVEASAEVTAIAALTPSVGVEISALAQGFTADISADTPRVTAKLKALYSSTCEACGRYESGLEGSLSVGAGITAAVKRRSFNSYTTLWSLPIVNWTMPPFLDWCMPLGIDITGNCGANNDPDPFYPPIGKPGDKPNYPGLPETGKPPVNYPDVPDYPAIGDPPIEKPNYPDVPVIDKPSTEKPKPTMVPIIGKPSVDNPKPPMVPIPHYPIDNCTKPDESEKTEPSHLPIPPVFLKSTRPSR